MRLPVMEHFYTIQGEGYNTGWPAYFIRMGGCDVGCVWCDVKDSWDAGRHSLFPVEEIAAWVTASGAQQAVITGGEPLMYDLTELCDLLHRKGLKTLLETSGAYSLSGAWDWICVSPKKFKAPLDSVLREADELKVVVYNRSDFDWANEHASKVSGKCRLFLQPEFGVFNKVMPEIIDFVKQHQQWRISLQVHKYMNIP